jgi:hypothetical protein
MKLLAVARIESFALSRRKDVETARARYDKRHASK